MSHNSTGSSIPYRIGSFNSNSLNVRLFVIVVAFVAVDRTALCCRNCSRSFNESDRPVPSYPLIVDERNTK